MGPQETPLKKLLTKLGLSKVGKRETELRVEQRDGLNVYRTNLGEATVGGVPTYELAETAKHDLEALKECCKAELKAFQRGGCVLAPAPYYFDRVTVVATKQKDWETVLEWGEAYLEALEAYKNTNTNPNKAQVWNSPRVESLQKRLAKARKQLGVE